MYDRIVQRVIPEVTFHQNRYARALDDAVREDERWLDLGAGARIHGGWRTSPPEALASRVSRLVGCDLEIDGMRRNPHLGLRVAGSGTALPFRNSTFGLVTANMVLEHLDDPARVFAEVARILAPGGRFLFVTPNRANPGVRVFSWLLDADLRRRAAGILEGRRSEDVFRTHYRANTVEAVATFAASAGLEVEHLEAFSSYPMLRRPALLTFAESLWIRTIVRRPSLRRLGSNLLGSLRKPSAGAETAQRHADVSASAGSSRGGGGGRSRTAPQARDSRRPLPPAP